jgi:hypothetical protein
MASFLENLSSAANDAANRLAQRAQGGIQSGIRSLTGGEADRFVDDTAVDQQADFASDPSSAIEAELAAAENRARNQARINAAAAKRSLLKSAIAGGGAPSIPGVAMAEGMMGAPTGLGRVFMYLGPQGTVILIVVIIVFIVVALLFAYITTLGQGANSNAETAIAAAKEHGCDLTKGCTFEQLRKESLCAEKEEEYRKRLGDLRAQGYNVDFADIACPTSSSTSSQAANPTP